MGEANTPLAFCITLQLYIVSNLKHLLQHGSFPYILPSDCSCRKAMHIPRADLNFSSSVSIFFGQVY